MKYTNNTIRINFIFIICIVLLFGLFLVKLGYVALSDEVEGTNLKELADSRSIVTNTLKAQRGSIYDKNGTVLAQNVNSYTVIAILSESRTTDIRYPKHVVDKELTAEKLSEVLNMDKDTIYRLLCQDKYQVEFGTAGKDISEFTKQKIEALALPGIEFIQSKKRYYPNGDFASYIVGYAKKYDNPSRIVGELGIEGYADRYLKGTDGSITYQKDAYGYQIQLANKYSYTVPAQDGYDIYLTLDEQVQLPLEDAVSKFKERFLSEETSWVTITIADAKTGAIVGSATSPSFDPNKLNIKNYNNPLLSYTYEPGSTMKIFSFMSAIEENLYEGDSLYKSGSIPVENYKISDWNKKGWGSISFDVGFTYSSNVAAALLAQKLGRATLSNYYDNLGFGSKTGIELANEMAGKISIDSKVNLVTSSYGQGMTVTPIQMVQALSVLTNDGTVLKPFIIDHIVDQNTGEVVYEGKRTELRKVYSTSTVNKIVELMDLTVNGSDKAATGAVYHTDSVRLIGKTGTANYAGNDGKYVSGTYNNIRSFAGVFPKEDPEYIIYVAVKDFKGTSSNMGTIVKDVVESVAKYREFDETPVEKDLTKLLTTENYISTTTLTALNKLNKVGATAVVIGDGDIVINQYPKKNVTTTISSKVFLKTNGNIITMPNVIGWSYSEISNFCTLANINCEINGYGEVLSTNINENDIITEEMVLKVTLQSAKSTTTVEEDDQDE